jgi:hypothetical protein
VLSKVSDYYVGLSCMSYILMVHGYGRGSTTGWVLLPLALQEERV